MSALVELSRLVVVPSTAPAKHRLLPTWFSIRGVFSQPTVMMLRNITHHPIRAGFTMLGMALATGILIVSLFTRDPARDRCGPRFFGDVSFIGVQCARFALV
jgi:hypothetical protein